MIFRATFTYNDQFLHIADFPIISLRGDVSPPFTGFYPLLNQSAEIGLTVEILGVGLDYLNPVTGESLDSYTYRFKLAPQPVPEPASILLLIGGIGALGAFKRQK